MLNRPPNAGPLSMPSYIRGVIPGGLSPQLGAQSVRPVDPASSTPQIMPPLYPMAPMSPPRQQAPELPSDIYTRSIQLSASEERDIVSQVNMFKLASMNHAKPYKQSMRRNYAYFNNEFFGDDLFPRPSTSGSDKDASKDRPQVFIPATRELGKSIYAFIKLSIFPNDEDYFRVRAKYPDGADLEDDLTEGLKYLFKQHRVTDSLGEALLDSIWSGMMAVYPNFYIPVGWEWGIDPWTGQFSCTPKEKEPILKVNVWNPLHLYLDPVPSNQARWGYYAYKKQQDVLDSVFTNPDKIPELKKLGTNNPYTSQPMEGLSIGYFNKTNETFLDNQKSLLWDTYWFPYIKCETTKREFRNMWICVAENSCLAEFRPNMPFSESPMVYCTWMPGKETLYGKGPVDDIATLQRIINLLENYVIETLARNGHKWAVSKGTDISNLFGVVSAVVQTPTNKDVREAIMSLGADLAEIPHVLNHIGMLKAEMTQLAGSQDPFQGASNIDFQKTATEMQLLNENSISVNREVIEHLGTMGISKILERLSLIAAHLYPEPITIRTDDPKEGPQFKGIDLSPLKSGDYIIELIGTNASQSKQAQAALLMQLITLVSTNPQGFTFCEPIIRKLAILNGEKDAQKIIDEIKEIISGAQQQQPPQPGMGGPSDAPPIQQHVLGGVPQAIPPGVPSAPMPH